MATMRWGGQRGVERAMHLQRVGVQRRQRPDLDPSDLRRRVTIKGENFRPYMRVSFGASGWIGALGVAPEARRHGVGRALTEAAVARLLVENNESEEQANQQIRQTYDRVERRGYLFLGATLTAILLTSLYVIYANRQLFAQLATLSEQRSDLAQKLISTQESTLRHISRELHDEFGQILTAVGSMLGRAQKHTPENSPLRTELKEVRDVAQATLDTVRSLSQALHPSILEEVGFEGTLDWYLSTVERQTGIEQALLDLRHGVDADGKVIRHRCGVDTECVTCGETTLLA